MAFVKTEVQGAVEIITIDRPKALNALNPEVLADLKAAFEAVDQETVRCIVLTGEGDKSFVAGADIGSMSTMTKAEGEAFGKLGNDVFLMIESFPIPVIAAVNGFALGGGNELAMSCDIRICSDNAVFGQPEVGLGPIAATKKVMAKTGMTVADMDLVEANEAFAAQSIAVGEALGFDKDKLNVNGGAIALGHPVGASGARILVTLLYAMKHRGAHKGLATLCIGGGMGCATIVEMD